MAKVMHWENSHMKGVGSFGIYLYILYCQWLILSGVMCKYAYSHNGYMQRHAKNPEATMQLKKKRIKGG